ADGADDVGVGGDRGGLLPGSGAVQPGAERARLDDQHLDPERGHLDGGGLRQAFEGELGDTVRANPTAPTAQDGDAPASVAACLPGARAGQPDERFLTCPRHAFRDDAAAGPSGGVVTLRYRQMAGTRRRRVPRLVPRTLIMVERG